MKHGPVDRGPATPGDGAIETTLSEAATALEHAAETEAAFLWTGGKEAQVILDLLLYTVEGDTGQSPIPLVTIDTGNHYDEMYDFREDIVTPGGRGPPTGIQNHEVRRHDELLSEVINNDDDPRGYHGRGPDDWTVEDSCGALKVVPMRELIADGYDTLVTGRRGSDPLVAGTDSDFGVHTERRDPLPHDRVNPLANWTEPFVYAYIKRESVPLSDLYTEEGFRHTDAKCCTDEDDAVGEYGEGGRDPQKRQRDQQLEDMGYV